jgi:hypothetical protein
MIFSHEISWHTMRGSVAEVAGHGDPKLRDSPWIDPNRCNGGMRDFHFVDVNAHRDYRNDNTLQKVNLKLWCERKSHQRIELL